jgi:hypothetical protein
LNATKNASAAIVEPNILAITTSRTMPRTREIIVICPTVAIERSKLCFRTLSLVDNYWISSHIVAPLQIAWNSNLGKLKSGAETRAAGR